MVVFGRHDRDPLGFGRLGEPVVDLVLLGNGAGELPLQLVDGGGETGQMKDRALQEGPVFWRGGVLVQGNDVGAGLGQEGAYRGDDSGPVMAAE